MRFANNEFVIVPGCPTVYFTPENYLSIYAINYSELFIENEVNENS